MQVPSVRSARRLQPLAYALAAVGAHDLRGRPAALPEACSTAVATPRATRKRHTLGDVRELVVGELGRIDRQGQFASQLRTSSSRRPSLAVVSAFLLKGTSNARNGVSLTQRVKAVATLATIPILPMSGDSRLETLVRSIKVTPTGFVVKPFTPQSLTNKLEKVLKG